VEATCIITHHVVHETTLSQARRLTAPRAVGTRMKRQCRPKTDYEAKLFAIWNWNRAHRDKPGSNTSSQMPQPFIKF